MNFDTDNPQFTKFLKYGIRRDHTEWFLHKSPGDTKICNKKPNYSLSFPANFSSNLVVSLPKGLNQGCLKNRSLEEPKYVNYNHNLNALSKAPFGIVTVFPEDKNPKFSSHSNSQESVASSYNASLCPKTKWSLVLPKLSQPQNRWNQRVSTPNQIPNWQSPFGKPNSQ